ncbi:ParA family protein [Gluconobacter oxydans]|uniref:ParA family protein n=1 Tax=Acetobacteraceae TaxID=433 RepID=UPI0039EA86A4
MNGNLLRELRTRLRLSQGDLKDKLNRLLDRSYDKPRISRWENNKEPIPDDVAHVLTSLVSNQTQVARVVVMANQKGGVGKTTSSLNLAYALKTLGCRVLLVDMDPQATATIGLLAGQHVEAYHQGKTSAQLILNDKPIGDVILHPDDVPEELQLPYDLIASHIELSETDSRREPGFDVALREAIDSVKTAYDWVVVDAPPNLGMLTWMSLAAGDEVIVPVRTEPYDTMGVGLIMGTISKIQRRLNPGLRLSGILPTQYNARKSVDREVLQHLQIMLRDKTSVLIPVPSSAVYGHAARAGRVALESSPTSHATLPYLSIAKSLNDRSPLPLAPVVERETV